MVAKGERIQYFQCKVKQVRYLGPSGLEANEGKCACQDGRSYVVNKPSALQSLHTHIYHEILTRAPPSSYCYYFQSGRGWKGDGDLTLGGGERVRGRTGIMGNIVRRFNMGVGVMLGGLELSGAWGKGTVWWGFGCG